MQNNSEEPQSFQQQALQIREPDANFDPDKPPESGEEYLMHMAYERSNCPAVVTKRPTKATKNDAIVTANGYVKLNIANPAPTEHACLLTTPEWQKVQTVCFKAMRTRILVIRRELDTQHYDQTIEHPLTSDTGKWQQFCRENSPLLSILLRLSQSNLEQLLHMQSTWLKAKSLQPKNDETVPSTSAEALSIAARDSPPIDLHGREKWLAKWIYATMACLHLPLEPNVYSTMRCIARSCLLLRNGLQPKDEKRAAPYNLLVTIIAIVFSQADLNAFL